MRRLKIRFDAFETFSRRVFFATRLCKWDEWRWKIRKKRREENDERHRRGSESEWSNFHPSRRNTNILTDKKTTKTKHFSCCMRIEVGRAGEREAEKNVNGEKNITRALWLLCHGDERHRAWRHKKWFIFHIFFPLPPTSSPSPYSAQKYSTFFFDLKQKKNEFWKKIHQKNEKMWRINAIAIDGGELFFMEEILVFCCEKFSIFLRMREKMCRVVQFFICFLSPPHTCSTYLPMICSRRLRCDVLIIFSHSRWWFLSTHRPRRFFEVY